MSRQFRFILYFLLSFSMSAHAELSKKDMQDLKLQVFLDRHHFTPGYIDARAGTFTSKAIINYNSSLGRAPNDIRIKEEAQESIKEPLALTTIPSFANKFVDPTLSEDRLLQSQRSDMPYKSYAEFIAERFHTSTSFLKKINPKLKFENLKPRSALLVPNVNPFLIESLGGGRTHKPDPKLSPHVAVIDTKQSQLLIYQKKPFPTPRFYNSIKSLFAKNSSFIAKLNQRTEKHLFDSLSSGQLVASFPITTGKSKFLRKGYWKVKLSIELPIWRYDKQLLETGERGKESLVIPGGPNNPIGAMWHGLSRPGIGIHGTSSPETIGRSKSAGCVRLANWDVVRLPNYIRPGDSVWLK